VSRNLLDIGERNRHMEKGFGLVAARSNPMTFGRRSTSSQTKAAPFFTPSPSTEKGKVK
jgi:hypothetical protein